MDIHELLNNIDKDIGFHEKYISELEGKKDKFKKIQHIKSD